MLRGRIPLLVAIALLTGSSAAPIASWAQTSPPPSYVAAPEVYKLLAENDSFRVILATWKPGQRDAWHAHAGALVAYPLTACKARIHTPDGKSIDRDIPVGAASFSPQIPSHSFENAGTSDCQTLIVEKK